MTAPVASSYPSPQPEPNEHPRPLWAVVGALVFVVFGLALLVPAVHIATEPILLPTAAGPPFDCGTALQPPTRPFPIRVCGAQPLRYQQQAAAWAIGAVIIGAGGALAFLVPTRARGARHTRRRNELAEDVEST